MSVMRINIIALLIGLISTVGRAQTLAPCIAGQNVCATNGTSFQLNTQSSPTGLPGGLTVSNPGNGSLPPGNSGSGCLFSNGTYPNWFVISVGSAGNLEFTIGQSGGSGFYDWALWPFNPSNPSASCNAIFNNTQAPVACNWNASAGGFTGMWNGGTPPGGNIGNFVPSLPVVAGQSFILLFSNYSGISGNTNLSFPSNPGSASISCTPGTPDQTICLGNSATVNIVSPIPIVGANWLVTNGVSNTSGWTNVTVTPTVTTQYIVQLNLGGGVFVNDTFNINVVNPPAPNAGPDQTVCLGTPILLNGSVGSSTNTASWQAIVPPGLTPPATASFSPNFSSLTPTVTVNQPGVYKFVLRETSTLCGLIRDTVTVTVSQVTLTATPTNPSCFGGNDGQITITSTGATQFSYDNGVTWVASNTQGGFAAGTYSVCAKNALGCQKCVNTTLTNPAAITISLSNDTLICENGTATMVATAAGGTSYVYHWSHTGSTSATQQVTPNTTGYYPVYAESNLGCISPLDSILVSIRPGLSGVMSPAPSTCPGYPESITVTPSGGIGIPYTMVWNTGQNDVGTTSTLTDSPQNTTNYSVTISDGCESTPVVINGTINTYPVPVPAIAVDAPIKCEPAVFNLFNTTDPNMVQNTIWRLSNNDEFIDMNQITTSSMMAGFYTVQLIVTSPDGCIDSTTWNNYLTVQPTPIADFKWSPEPITMFNTQVLFTSYSLYADTYSWSFPGATPNNSTNDDQSVLYPDGQTGTYDVTLIAYSNLGCSDTITKQVIIYPEVIIYAPNAFTPDGDEFNQSWRIHIEGIDQYDFELQIFNRWGEVVWESHDPDAAWDGTYNGKIVPYGGYTWIVRTREILSDKKYTWNGHINVIR